MRYPEHYTLLGSGLILGGGAFALIAWLVFASTPLIALGLSGVIVGVVALVLARSLPDLSPELGALLFQTGLENLSALVEEIGPKTRALYLPGRLAGRGPMALIPLHENSSSPQIRRPLPPRLVVSYGPNPQDVGLLIRTAGTTVIRLVGPPRGGSSSDLESAIGAALVAHLDLADGVHVFREGERVVVQIAAARLSQRDLYISRTLGSPLASIVATLVAEGLDRPVQIHSEDVSARQTSIVVEPFDETVQ